MNESGLMLWLLATALLAACQPPDHPASSAPPPPDVLASARDTTVHPGDDFFAYANGTWLKNHPIPASASYVGIAREVREEVSARLRHLVETAAKTPNAPGSVQQKIGDFYALGLDSARAERLGLAPLAPALARIAALRTVADVPAEAARLRQLGVDVLLSASVGQDDRHSEKMVLYLRQGGLGLPERAYYLGPDAAMVSTRRAYGQHLTRMFELLGQPAAAAARHGAQVLALETALARASRKLEDLRDPVANYHALPVAGLHRLAPQLDWPAWLRQLGAARADTVIVAQPEFVRAVGQLLARRPLADWQAYLQVHLADTYASYLHHALDQESFHFYYTVLDGTPTPKPRWQRVVETQEDEMGMLLGQQYVHDYCSARAKARYERLTDQVLAAFDERLRHLDWMSAPTRQAARRKLARVGRKVGYPDQWRDHAQLHIGRDSYAQNVMRTSQWNYRYHFAKLGRPVNHAEWYMTPQTYNAYYSPAQNELVLPAAIFTVPGMADESLDDALLYGYVGASTVGHELMHGFDDAGSQFDEKGNLRQWWSPADRRRFAQRVRRIERQFGAYTVLDSLHLNGKATAGENIADLGGLVVAYEAFQKTAQYRQDQKTHGLTPAQRFFLGYALGFQEQERPERLAEGVRADEHAPARFRVNGPLANLPAFYAAFGVQPGQALYRPDSARVRIW